MKTARQILDERMCRDCRRRFPRRQMTVRKTPVGGRMYTCAKCEQSRRHRKLQKDPA